MSRQRYRRWHFVINNPTESDREAVNDLDCRYICVGYEHGNKKGTPHFQGYVEMERAIDLKSLKKLLGGRARVEQAKGSAEQNREYCSKENLVMEKGSPARPGARCDIASVKEVVKKTGRMRDVIEIATGYQSLKCGELLLKYISPARKSAPEVYWYWGPAGSGKTRRAVEEAGEDFWMSSRNLKWWDGYDGHEHVIIDDFRADFCTFHELLRILDRYPMRVEVKGGSRVLLATKIWITSCHAPQAAYPGCGERIEQLLRRITRTVEFNGLSDSGTFGTEVGGNTVPRPPPSEDELKIDVDEMLNAIF